MDIYGEGGGLLTMSLRNQWGVKMLQGMNGVEATELRLGMENYYFSKLNHIKSYFRVLIVYLVSK